MDKSNVSDKRRTFLVFFDKNVASEEQEEETIIIEPGEDADEVCGGVLQEMINNSTYSGWDEADEPAASTREE